MRIPDRVPTLLTALALSAGLAACGGDAESAGDLDSVPFEESFEESPGENQAAPPAVQPTPAPTPPPAARPPAPRPPATQPPPPPVVTPPEPEVETPPATPEVPEGVTVPLGTQMTGVLESGLSTRTSNVGDVFYARVAEGLRASDGSLILPEGTRLEGRVVESRESTSAEEPAALLLEIRALMVDGERYPIQATVLETEVAAEARDSAQRSVATVATGAAAGALLGRILGRDTRSTVAGAAAGAAAGAGIALTTRDGHAELGEGARITVRLDAPVVVAN